MRLILIAAVAAGVAGCVPQRTEPKVPTSPYDLTTLDRSAIEVGVRSKLKDPESARFGRFVAVRPMGRAIQVCGFVNAKNSFGGYTGDEIFIGVLTREGTRYASFLATDLSSRNDQYGLARRICMEDGIIL